jgi:MFS family permease
MREAFRVTGFRRLFTGMSTSMLGDSLMLLVLAIWVKTLTGSNSMAGLTFLFMVVPALFAPLLGMWIDRFRRRPLLIWGNLASSLVVLPLLLVRDASDVWVIWVVAFFYGISFIVLPAALNGLLKELMPERLLVDANSSLQTVKEGYRLLGPLLGAGLFGWLGGGAVAVVDAVSFVVAAAFVAWIPLREERPVRVRQHWWAEMTGGLRHLVHERLLRHTLVAFGLMLLVIGFSEAAIFAILDAFDKPATFAGVVVTVQGVGAVVGGLTASRWVRRLGETGAVVVGLGLLAGSLAVIAATSTLGVMLVAVVPLGYSVPVLFIAFTTLMQRRTPQSLIGRVSTAVETVMGVPQALSLAVGALLVTLVSYHVIFGVMALVTGVGAVYLILALGRAVFRPPAPLEESADVPPATEPVPVGS